MKNIEKQIEELRKEAEQEREIAKQFKGCSWAGKEWPGSSHLRKANILENAALSLEMMVKK